MKGSAFTGCSLRRAGLYGTNGMNAIRNVILPQEDSSQFLDEIYSRSFLRGRDGAELRNAFLISLTRKDESNSCANETRAQRRRKTDG